MSKAKGRYCGKCGENAEFISSICELEPLRGFNEPCAFGMDIGTPAKKVFKKPFKKKKVWK
jgi:hypothetical protein